MPILTVEKLTKSFGGLTAVSNVNMVLNEGEMVGLIGPNGAGKTTVFNLLTGVYKPTSGTVTLTRNGTDQVISGRKPCDICKLGLARTFQNIRLFKDLTVLDNVRIAMNKDVKYGLVSSFLHLPTYQKEEKRLEEAAMDLLKLMKLDHKKNELAKNLPYGEQRHLEIARAMATNPALLLLDEPAAGMNPNETAELMDTIRLINREFDMTILLIEHDMKLVSGICEEVTVLNFGQVLAEGETSKVLNDPNVITAYLGEDE